MDVGAGFDVGGGVDAEARLEVGGGGDVSAGVGGGQAGGAHGVSEQLDQFEVHCGNDEADLRADSHGGGLAKGAVPDNTGCVRAGLRVRFTEGNEGG